MLVKRRDFIARSGAGLYLGGLALSAQAQDFVEGKHYRTLAQRLPTAVPAGKIEVIEFFWYGCPHCNAFEPVLSPWVKKLPADVVFHRVHVGFRPAFKPQQQLAAALEGMGLIEQMQAKVFAAIHAQNVRLDRPEQIIEFVASQGVDKAKFTEMYSSFGVQSKVRQGEQLAAAYKVDGVPAIGIHGRFYTSPSMAAGGDDKPEAEGHVAVLNLIDQLVQRIRKGG
jgi:thiol:disulfide interchange protein DsbA